MQGSSDTPNLQETSPGGTASKAESKSDDLKVPQTSVEEFILLFNKHYNDGINFLISSNIIDDSPEKIAQILHSTEGLDKKMIGECFGDSKPKYQDILKAYCKLFDFKGVELHTALKQLLSSCSLPGEAQKIDRIIEIFGSVYQEVNPTVFIDANAPYILSFAFIMLNTDAHSPMISNKMKKQDFVKMCQGSAISQDYIEKVYDEIVKENLFS